MITTVTSVQRFATKTLYTRARATDGSTMLAPMSPARDRKCVNPTEVIKSRVFAPLSRALVGRGGAREVLGWTAVAQCPTLSAKYFSVSLKISICGLTNMAKSTTLPHSAARSNGDRK